MELQYQVTKPNEKHILPLVTKTSLVQDLVTPQNQKH